MAHPKHDRIYSANSTAALVRAAYLQADAMLHERDQPTDSLEEQMREENELYAQQSAAEEERWYQQELANKAKLRSQKPKR